MKPFELETVRLKELVKRAVGLGLSLEDRYTEAQRQYHNYQDWSEDQWQPIDDARTELCRCLDMLETGDETL